MLLDFFSEPAEEPSSSPFDTLALQAPQDEGGKTLQLHILRSRLRRRLEGRGLRTSGRPKG